MEGLIFEKYLLCYIDIFHLFIEKNKCYRGIIEFS